jgi:hypothetical protein
MHRRATLTPGGRPAGTAGRVYVATLVMVAGLTFLSRFT